MRKAALTLPLIVALSSLSGCGGDPAPVTAPTASAGASIPVGPADPREQLASRAAAAKDLRQVAFYTLKSAKRPDRQVSITRAVDGSWRIDIAGGALGGAVDIALVYAGNALHQCALPAANHPYSGCVKIAGRLPAKADPKIEYLITDWLKVLTDRRQALAVSPVAGLAGAGGACFSVESSAASLTLPMDAGIYCYETDGTLTAARLSFGTLTLSGAPGAAPPSVVMPGPVVPGQPLQLGAPPSPRPSGSASPTTPAKRG